MRPPFRLLPMLALLLVALPAAPACADEAQPVAPAAGGPRAAILANRDGRTTLGGYYDLEFKQPLDGLNGSNFDLHRVVLQASSVLHERLSFNAEIEFEHGGLVNGSANPGDIELEQAWADYRFSDALGLRAGVVLIPFGIVNVLHDSDIRETTTRPLMAGSIIPTTWFEPGIGLHGQVEGPRGSEVSYEGYVTQGLTDRISPALGLLGARPYLGADNNGNKALSGRVGISPWLGLAFGLDGYYGAYDPAGVQHLAVLGADADWRTGPFELVGEYANVQTEGGSASVGVPTAIPTAMDGLYVEGRYHFFPELLNKTVLGTAGGFEHAAFTLVARGGYADTNKAAFDASDHLESLVGLNYRPVPAFVVKAELQRIDEPATGRADHTIWSSVAVGF